MEMMFIGQIVRNDFFMGIFVGLIIGMVIGIYFIRFRCKLNGLILKGGKLIDLNQ